jgi:alpha-galactosidase
MRMKNNLISIILPGLSFAFLLSACEQNTVIENGKLMLEVNTRMQTRVSFAGESKKTLMNDFQNTEFLITGDNTIQDFKLSDRKKSIVSDKIGKGTNWLFTGRSFGYPETVIKNVSITVYDNFPDWAFYNVKYINTGTEDMVVKKWVNNSLSINTKNDTPDFWSFQGSSGSGRKDWILPVKSGFFQKNFLGMNSSDYGGGIPVIDLWRKDGGIAIGHTEIVPKMVSLPVEMKKNATTASISVEDEFINADTLHPGDTLNTFGTFISLHNGDYFSTLRRFSLYMQKKGIVMPEAEPAAFEPIWCAWGYERKFTIDEILGTLEKVRDIGFKWVGIDDGYQKADGDWHVNTTTFPGGDAQMRSLVDKIHAYGLKAQIWWAPLAVAPQSNLFANHPEIIIQDQYGVPEYITWWDSYYMSPVYKGTIDHTRETIQMFLGDWNYDGLKLDGQHLNACMPDYNPQHHLSNPQDAPEGMPAFFKVIYQTARQLKPHSIIELCPCGDAMSFYNIPYTNQFVASDPESSNQIRSKGKTFKAIAPQTAYFGDHAERSNSTENFASTIGVGGVPGSKFTWPADNPFVTEGHFVLTPEQETLWKKWITIYNQTMLSTGNYLGDLYDIGYDKPETHVIQKGDTLYYAFYADNWHGKLTLKGLAQREYKIYDYYNDKDYGTIMSDKPEIEASFNKFLLLMACPATK